MEKIIVLTTFFFFLSGIWCQSLIMYQRFSLDMDDITVRNILSNEFVGKYRIEKNGNFVVTVDANKTLYMQFYSDKISTMRVVIRNASFSQFVKVSSLIIATRGEPDTCRPNGYEYRVEWYGKGSDPGWALVFTDEAPFTFEEILTYEK